LKGNRDNVGRLKEMWEEMEEAERSSREFLKNNPHLVKKK